MRYALTLITASLMLALAFYLLNITGTPCPTEDSTNCVWLATRQGNGLGRSFIAVFNSVFYIS